MTWVCWLHETRPFTSNEVVVQSNQRQFISCQLQLRITALTAVVIDLQFMFLAYTQSPTLFDVFLRDGLICEYTGIRYRLFTSDNGGGKCNCPRCLSVCLLARLLKNACMDFDDILRVDRCRDMDELINFWVRSRSYSGCWNRIAFSHSVCTATRNLLRWENPMYWYWAPIEAATHGF